MPPESSLGFAHFLGQSDAVGRTLLVILLAMSVLSWIIIALKGLAQTARQRRSRSFLDFFWNASSLESVQHEIATHGARDPFSHLAAHAIQASRHHARYGAAKLAEAGSASDFVTRTIKKVLDEETTRLENGLTVLATVGATAPFVGLFGTVWGVYHALVAIGMSAGGTGTSTPISGSTVSGNLAGCAVATSTHGPAWRRAGGRLDQISAATAVCGHQVCANAARSARIRARIWSSLTDAAVTLAPSARHSGNRCRRRSMLLGLPTSIADASVGTLARGRHSPEAR